MRFFAPLFFAVLSDCCFFTIFLRFPHTLFVKGNSTTTFHSVGYSIVKEHFGSDSLDLFIRSYSPAELFNPLYWIAEKPPKN